METSIGSYKFNYSCEFNFRGVLEVKLWDHSEKKNLSAIAYQDHEGRYSSSEPTSFLDRYKVIAIHSLTQLGSVDVKRQKYRL